MTTVAAIMGALPLAIGVGESADMLRGLELVIVGGAYLLAGPDALLTPVLYVTFEGWTKRGVLRTSNERFQTEGF